MINIHFIRETKPPRKARPYFSKRQFEPVFKDTTQRLRDGLMEKKALEAARGLADRVIGECNG